LGDGDDEQGDAQLRPLADSSGMCACWTPADLDPQVQLTGVAQPGQPQPRRPADLEQFRYAFANVVSEEVAKQLYEDFAVPASGKSLFRPRRPT
jgi:hypothetical protein